MKQPGIDIDRSYTHVAVNVMFAQRKVDDVRLDVSKNYAHMSFKKVKKLFSERAVSTIA